MAKTVITEVLTLMIFCMNMRVISKIGWQKIKQFLPILITLWVVLYTMLRPLIIFYRLLNLACEVLCRNKYYVNIEKVQSIHGVHKKAPRRNTRRFRNSGFFFE